MEQRITIRPDQRADFTNNADFCVGTGRLGLGLQAEYQEQLRAVQAQCHFRYIEQPQLKLPLCNKDPDMSKQMKSKHASCLPAIEADRPLRHQIPAQQKKTIYRINGKKQYEKIFYHL